MVTGGIGVRGMTDMLSGNTSSGADFTFRMLLEAFCLALGVFIAMIPRKRWFFKRKHKTPGMHYPILST